MIDNIKVTGKVSAVLRDSEGKVKQEVEIKNLVVTAGKNFIASRMTGAAAAVMGWIAVGTDATAAAVGQTTLLAEVGSSRTATDVSGGTASGANVVYTTTLGAGVGTGALTEAGVFNDASAGTMLARTVFTTINKGALDSLDISWTITIG